MTFYYFAFVCTQDENTVTTLLLVLRPKLKCCHSLQQTYVLMGEVDLEASRTSKEYNSGTSNFYQKPTKDSKFVKLLPKDKKCKMSFQEFAF